MRPLPFEPVTPVSFDEENACYYIAFLSAINVTMTYLESTRSIGRGILAGAAGIVMMLIVYWLVRRNLR